MSSTARAEARRKAILSRGGDRLAKLTTSARGEDAPAFSHDDVPARSGAAFVGEEMNLTPPPLPPKMTPRPSPPPPTQPDPSVWSEEQQHQFMQALLAGVVNTGSASSSTSSSPPLPSFPPPPVPPSGEDPFAHMMAQLTRMGGSQHTRDGAGTNAATGKVPASPPKPLTRLQKWMPLLHLVCMWSLLAVFVMWKQPQTFVEKTAGAVEMMFWRRWSTLMPASRGMMECMWSVQVVPFFWAFMTLQVMLHSLWILTGHNEVQPPALLSVALPHLPQPFPSLILNTLRYIRMGSVFLDDVAAVVFGIGMIALISTWFVD